MAGFIVIALLLPGLLMLVGIVAAMALGRGTGGPKNVSIDEPVQRRAAEPDEANAERNA